MRQVLDRALDGVDQLLSDRARLPRVLASRRLAAESAVIVAIARRLAAELRRRDPLAERVELGRAAVPALRRQGLGMALGRAPAPRGRASAASGRTAR